MSSIRIEFVSQGFHDILVSQPVADLVDSTGKRVASRAGDGFGYRHRIGNYGGGRVIGLVTADTMEARESEATGKTLTRAVGG